MLGNDLQFDLILTELARGSSLVAGNLQQTIDFLIAKSAQTLGVQRANVWLFNDERTAIKCFAAYDTRLGKYNENSEITVAGSPSYFAALEKLRTLAVFDTESDSRTREMRDVYLHQRGIKTLLDTPIFTDGAVIGVVCHEEIAVRRVWSEREKGFVIAISDLISLSFETERRITAERRWHDDANLLQIVAAEMSDGFALLEKSIDGELIYKYLNPNAAQIYGATVEELIGKPAICGSASSDAPQLIEQARKAAEQRRTVTYETEVERKDGTMAALELNVNVIRHNGEETVSLVGRDITERRNAERQRLATQAKTLHNERLESLGLLAGGVAHDFNNLLGVISANLNLLETKCEKTPGMQKYLDNITASTHMAAELCHQLLIYAGEQKSELSALNLSVLVEEMFGLLQVSLPARVTLERQTAHELSPILAEPTQIRQILLNLITNAVDAVGDKNGLIRVVTGNVAAFAVMQSEIIVGDVADFENWVFLEVADDGSGMDEATRRKMFEPFFTTKPTGRGLGMATLGGIVRAHRGVIAVDSQIGRGTTIRIFFPTAGVK